MEADLATIGSAPIEEGLSSLRHSTPLLTPKEQLQYQIKGRDLSQLAMRNAVELYVPKITSDEDNLWDGEIEEIQRPFGVIGDGARFPRRPYGVAVISTMMYQFNISDNVINPQNVICNSMIPFGGYGFEKRFWPPFGMMAVQPMRQQRPCPIHGFYRAPRTPPEQVVLEPGTTMLPSIEGEDFRIPTSEVEMALMDPMKIELIRKHLLVLLHAHSCHHRESAPDGERYRNCNLPFCKVTKCVVIHMKDCKNKADCSFPQCVTSWRLIHHYGLCRRADCLICKPYMDNPQTFCNNNTTSLMETDVSRPRLPYIGSFNDANNLFRY